MSDHQPNAREEWIALLEELYEETSTEASHLPCFEHCPECLCERKENEKVYFLPYEIDFIQQRTGIDLRDMGVFWILDIPAAEGDQEIQSLPIALKGKLHHCPFLSEGNRCLIHKDRPFDCRSFPLMPTFHRGRLDFELEAYCPLVSTRSGALLGKFVELYKGLWQKLLPKLPDGWKRLYWESNGLVPEINDPSEPPRPLDVSLRLIRVETVKRRIK